MIAYMILYCFLLSTFLWHHLPHPPHLSLISFQPIWPCICSSFHHTNHSPTWGLLSLLSRWSFLQIVSWFLFYVLFFKSMFWMILSLKTIFKIEHTNLPATHTLNTVYYLSFSLIFFIVLIPSCQIPYFLVCLFSKSPTKMAYYPTKI